MGPAPVSVISVYVTIITNYVVCMVWYGHVSYRMQKIDCNNVLCRNTSLNWELPALPNWGNALSLSECTELGIALSRLEKFIFHLRSPPTSLVYSVTCMQS